ncbi:MAG: exo-alpha-sialidase [Opitutaceae bacterium]|nr:exo-alpha-sialidase [Opitutaceae bacterium]
MVEATLVARDACAWPVLTRLADDRLGIVYHNRPSHGFTEGDLAACVSEDEGAPWSELGLPAPHLPGTSRTHIASGLDHAGRWVVLSTGHTLRDGAMVGIQPVWYSTLRGDNARWQVDTAPRIDVPSSFCIPHGRVLALPDGRLAATVYRSWGQGQPSRTWMLFSTDGGASWGDSSEIGNGDTNEAVVIDRDASGLLAVVRTHRDHHLELFASTDTGRTWMARGPVTLPMQHPGDLTDLGRDRVLLTYGIRNRGLMGLGARLSKDGGATWGAPAVIYQFGEARDCGYPSTMMCRDGALLTASYSDKSSVHDGYHLLTVRWRLEEFFDPKPLGSISDGRPLAV